MTPRDAWADETPSRQRAFLAGPAAEAAEFAGEVTRVPFDPEVAAAERGAPAPVDACPRSSAA